MGCFLLEGKVKGRVQLAASLRIARQGREREPLTPSGSRYEFESDLRCEPSPGRGLTGCELSWGEAAAVGMDPEMTRLSGSEKHQSRHIRMMA